MPWVCPHNTVTLTWHSKLEVGQSYYWQEIPIPPSLIRDGKLCGRGKLTAILSPYSVPSEGSPYLLLSQETDSNYFSARLAVALQYRKDGQDGKKGKKGNLIDSKKGKILPDHDAKVKLHTWSPVRHHYGPLDSGINPSKGTMQLYARVYTRDPYQNKEVAGKHPSLEVAFVLSLSSDSSDGDVYNEMRTALGPQVESAVIDQQLDVER